MKTFCWKAPAFVLAVLCLASPAVAGSAKSVPDPDVCGDVNSNGKLTSSDALAVLRAAVGQPQELICATAPFTADFGYEGEFTTESEFNDNYLLGTRVNIAQDITVTNLGIVSRQAGTHVKMALYTDVAGSPNALVVSSQPATVIEGRQAINVPATAITAGDYWVMAVFDATTSIAADDELKTNTIRYRAQQYGDDMPLLFGPNLSYAGTPMNHFVKGVP